MNFRLVLILAIVLLFVAGVAYESLVHATRTVIISTTPAQTDSSTTSTSALPARVQLSDGYYVPQTFNNCAESALSMDLSFYNVNVSQEELADIMRPDHNSTGIGDDKSTTPDVIAAQAQTYGLVAYYRPAGNIELLKQLLNAGFPVVVRTLFMASEPVAHYRVVTGYNDATQQITEEDGFQGPSIIYSYNDFMSIWKYYNYEYVVLASPSKQSQLEGILGNDIDATTAWQEAAANATQDLAQNSSDYLAAFNLSVADYYLGNYAQSVQYFEQAQPSIPPDTLWYQLEPIESYYELGDYAQVFSLAQQILAKNPAYPELLVIEGESYEKQGNTSAARSAIELALKYNPNLQLAQQALAALPN